MSMENSSDIGNRTRDLPACSAVPQSTAPPRTVQRNNIFPSNTDILEIDIGIQVLKPKICEYFLSAYASYSNNTLEVTRSNFFCSVFQRCTNLQILMTHLNNLYVDMKQLSY